MGGGEGGLSWVGVLGGLGGGWEKKISPEASALCFNLLKFATHSTGSLQFIIIGIVDLCVFFMH